MSNWKEERARDLAELAGEVTPVKRGPGRPRKNEVYISAAERARLERKARKEEKERLIRDIQKAGRASARAEHRREAKEDQDSGGFSTSSRELYKVANGVSVQWLAKAFGMTRHNVEQRIRGCRVVGSGDYGNPLYDLREAASYLVEPKIDVEEYIAKLKPEKLPERLRESFWNAKLKEQRWKRAAGELWETDRVMSVFAEVLGNIRDKLQLIPDTVERLGGLDVKQWQMVRNLVDQVQEEIHAEIVRFADKDSTLNQLGVEEDADDEDLA